MTRNYIILLSCFCVVSGKEGYFWHISDIHYDPNYSIQGNSEGRCWNMKKSGDIGRMRVNDKMPSAGVYGHYNCDSPWLLIESAAKAMKANHDDGIEFVLWTGDALSRHESMAEESRLQYLKNITDLLSHTFTGQFVFPVLGHEDIGLNYSQIANLWSNWLPDEALVTFRENGYYTIEQRSKNYQIISLNTNLWLSSASNTDTRGPNQQRVIMSSGASITGAAAAPVMADSDPANQWMWFSSTLNKARKKGKTIYIVGHTPPGVDDHEIGIPGLAEEHNARYLQIIRQYADMIRGQFFGHWHSDTFRVVYGENDEPVSWIMVAPSITPYRVGGSNNPGLRLYKFDNDTGQILDYAQYYLNLLDANLGKRANWRLEYNLKEHFELTEVTAQSLHDFADRFTQPRHNAFVRYYEANRVSLAREVEEFWGCGGALNGLCALQHYCAVTRLTPRTYSSCVSSYAYALASAVAGIQVPGSLVLLLVMFSLLFTR